MSMQILMVQHMVGKSDVPQGFFKKCLSYLKAGLVVLLGILSVFQMITHTELTLVACLSSVLCPSSLPNYQGGIIWGRKDYS